jgi:hypothetical protein
MSGVFRNIDPPTPSPPGECVPPRLWCGGRTHSLGGEGVGVNSSEDVRHCSVLYICKYFVVRTLRISPHTPQPVRVYCYCLCMEVKALLLDF